MLTHAFRAIKAGWVFQLNADVTGKLCRKSVNLLTFLGHFDSQRNNTLCLCNIPSTTENEQAYTVVYNELRKAECLMPSIKPCDNEDCVSCGIITALLADDRCGRVRQVPAMQGVYISCADGHVRQF